MNNIDTLSRHFFKQKIEFENKNTSVNAVIYTRVSTKEQMVTNHSLETQLKKCRELCKDKNYHIVKEFGNTHESGKTDNRKEFQQMLDFVFNSYKQKSEHKITAIVIYNFDRYSRAGIETFGTIEKLNAIGVKLVCVNYSGDTLSKEGRLAQGLSLLVGQFENQGRAEKSIEGTKHLLLNGGWPSRPTLGYEKINGPNKTKICVINDVGFLIGRAFKMKAQGMSNVDIIKWLKPRGLNLYPQRLTKIFKNIFYCGIIKHGTLPDQLIKGTHKPLISVEEFMIVNGIASNYLKSSHKKEDDNYPLKGTILCEKCRGNLTGYQANGKLAKYYKCNTKFCCMNINIKIVHEALIDNLKSLSINEIYIDPIIYQLDMIIDEQSVVQKNDAIQLSKEINKLEGEVYLIEEKIILSDKDTSMFERHLKIKNERLSELRNEKEKLKKNLSNLKDSIQDILILYSNIGKIWQNGNLYIRQSVQKLLFPKGIVFSKESGNYRTEYFNNFYGVVASISASYDNEKRGQIRLESNLSPLVARRGN